MAWELLPVDYTDAIWSGLKKFVQTDNGDGTVSFNDVTAYTNKEKSFFGAKDANRMNEAINTIMSMLENGTDLYEAFQNYFAAQKNLFEDKSNAEYTGLVDYTEDLKKQGDEVISTLQFDYREEMDAYESQQQLVFNTWFAAIRGQLSSDVAGKLQNEIDENSEKDFNRYYGMVNKTTSIQRDNSGNVSIMEAGDGVTATTTFETISNGKKIKTILTVDSTGAKYTKTVTIESTANGKNITESYKKEGA